jgi:phytanoyl-CoA hydroxylase
MSGCDALAERYAQDGYLLVRNAFDPAALDALRTLIDAQVDAYARELLARGRVRELHEGLPFPRRLAALMDGTGIRLRKWSTFLFGPEIHALVTNERLLHALRAVLGPEILFHGDYQLTPKLPRNPVQAFPWHQDTLYYGRASQHLHIVTVWVPLVPAHAANGCIEVLPGSHRWGLLDGVRGIEGNVHPLEDIGARGRPVHMEMQPGDALLMGNLTFHASGMNVTDEVRWSIDLGFSAASPEGVAADACTQDAAVEASREFVHAALREMGRTPLRVASADPARCETFAQWQRRHLGAADVATTHADAEAKCTKTT